MLYCKQFGLTPLYWASSLGRLKVVQTLLAAGADMESKNTKVGCEPIIIMMGGRTMNRVK